MLTSKFLSDLGDLLEMSSTLSLDTNLSTLDEFDSLALMALVAYIHKNFGKQFNARQLNEITTVDSLRTLIGKDCFE
jgi:acyl carrier protein